MFLEAYQPHELCFAYCYRVYLRLHTLGHQPRLQLASLDQKALSALVGEYGIHVLECASNAMELLAEVSLEPAETVSGCASKLKGRVSKWLRERLALKETAALLSKGYFACTTGKSTREAVEQYLNQQSEHHGYDRRVLPPIYTGRYELSHDDITRISPKHASVVAQFHIVLSTET
jgi:REP element-mobilizing transposase RayT